MCRLWVAFSATHSARWAGKRKFISAGASVPGVSWNSTVTPSRTSIWPVWVTSWVGAISDTAPFDVAWPRPTPIWPAGPRSRRLPYMYDARRPMAVPA